MKYDIEALAAVGGAVLRPRELEGLVSEIEAYGRSHPNGPGVTASLSFSGTLTGDPRVTVNLELNRKEGPDGER